MDDIKRKLAEIDSILTGRDALGRQIINACPLLFVSLGLIAGIIIQNHTDLPIHFWLITAILSAAAVLFYALRYSRHLYVTACLTLLCFLCLGAIRWTNYHSPAPNDIRNLISRNRTLATIKGTILTDPYIDEGRNWKFARFRHTDPPAAFYMALDQVKTIDGWAKVTGTLRVHLAEPVMDLKTADRIKAYCWLDTFKPPRNPGQFNTAEYLKRKGVFVTATIKSRDSIELLSPASAGILHKLKRKLKMAATVALVGDISDQQESYGLLAALLLGSRANISSETYHAFEQTGLLHFISLSGMHLGILVGIFWWICKIAGLSKPARATVCIIGIVTFLLVVQLRTPTLRAAIIALAYCASFLFGRRTNPFNTLSLAAIILLLINPAGIFEPGWQLSFASVLGILFFTKKIKNFIDQHFINRIRGEKNQKYIAAPAISLIANMFAVGFSAWIGGAGILLYHFYTINPLTAVWTIIVFPLVALILISGFAKMILAALLPTAAAALTLLTTAVCDLLIYIVKFIAGLNISEILIGSTKPPMIFLYYAFILLAAYQHHKYRTAKKIICIAMIFSAITLLGVTKWQRTHRNNLILTILDVGHGQAILAQLPPNNNILFDAGSLTHKNIGSRIVTPFLKYNAINKINRIIISHNDSDHINGIPEIAEYTDVADLYANEAFFDKTDNWGTAKFLDDTLTQKGLKIKPADKKFRIGNATITALWPTEPFTKNLSISDNDKSTVTLIEFAGKRILLCSDIEKFAQNQLLKTFGDLRANIVIAPHHGSGKTLDTSFIDTLNPDILICSGGQKQYENQKLRKRLHCKKILFTAENAAITICVKSDGSIEYQTFIPSDI